MKTDRYPTHVDVLCPDCRTEGERRYRPERLRLAIDVEPLSEERVRDAMRQHRDEHHVDNSPKGTLMSQNELDELARDLQASDGAPWSQSTPNYLGQARALIAAGWTKPGATPASENV